MKGLILKTNMNTKKLLTTLSIISLFSLPLIASGLATNVPVGTVDDVIGFLKAVLNILRAIFFALAAIFIVFAAYRYLTAQGDPEKITGAKTMLIYTVVALAIALVASSLQSVIADLLSRRA